VLELGARHRLAFSKFWSLLTKYQAQGGGDPMHRLWVFLEKRKSAREVIALVVPIAITVVGGAWAVFTYVFPAVKPEKATQPPAVTSGPGGVAAGRDISGSKINIGPLPNPSPESPRP
jgi:hypothetical protein